MPGATVRLKHTLQVYCKDIDVLVNESGTQVWQKIKVEKKRRNLKNPRLPYRCMSKITKVQRPTEEEQLDFEAKLLQMEGDTKFNTPSQYATDTVKYPSNTMSFSQKHIEHLRKFPEINFEQYLSNLRLMTRIR